MTPIDVEHLASITVELFQQGRRTVGYEDWQHAYGRDHDHAFNTRVIALLLDVVTEIQRRGILCTPVNDYCLRHYAEIAVTDPAVARRCNVFNSGGKAPVGIRRAIPDDLVRSEANGNQADLGLGSVRHSVQRNVNDVAQGVTPPELHDRLVSTIRGELPRLTEVQPDPVQAQLPE